MDKIILENELVNYIESLQYDVEARRSVVSHMVANGYDIESENFKKYQEELRLCIIKHNEAKEQITQMLKGKEGVNVSWNLNFATRELSYEKV